MPAFDHVVRPGLGLGPLRFGMSEARVRELLGEPEEVKTMDYPDATSNRYLVYGDGALELQWSTEEEDRLESITSHSPELTWEGRRLVGLTETQLLALDPPEHGPAQRNDPHDFGDEDFETWHGWDALSITCFVDRETECVYGVWLTPLWRDTETYVWPDGADT